MSTSLQELLKLAGIVVADPKATRPRRVNNAVPLGGDQPRTPSDAVPLGGDQPTTVPPVPALAQPPPRSLPPVNPAPNEGPLPMRPADQPIPYPEAEPAPGFGTSGEPFGSSRERRVEPRDFIQDDLAFAREASRQPRNKKLDILSGIITGLSGMDGRPAIPVDLSGRTRKLDDVYLRIGKELGVQKEQAVIKNAGSMQNYRNQQAFGSQQKRMLDHYKNSKIYRRGSNPAIDEMYAAADLEFEDKDESKGKSGKPYRFKHLGQVWEQYPGEDARPIHAEGGADLIDRSQVPVEVQGPISGKSIYVRPGAQYSGESQVKAQQGAQGRFEDSEARQREEFAAQETHRRQQEFYRRQKDAADAGEKWQKAYEDAQSLKAAVDQLEQKRLGNTDHTLYGDDAVHMATWPKMAEAAAQRAQSLMDELNTRHSDFYYVDATGLHAKDPQPPSAAAPQITAPSRKQGRTLEGAIKAFRVSEKREPTADEIVRMNAALNR